MLQQVDEIRLFPGAPFAKVATPELTFRSVEVFEQRACPRFRGLHHPYELSTGRFAFEVPEKFSIQNSDVNVVATGPNGGEFILDGGKAPTGSLERYIERDWVPQLTQGRESTPLSGLRTINVDGVEGATATLQVHYKGTMRNVQLTVYRLNGQLYRFQGIAKKGDTATQAALADAALSFEHLSEAEAAALKPYRIRVYKVREGDNLNVLAATIPMENLREERFRLMNNYDDGQELKAGDRVKLIVE